MFSRPGSRLLALAFLVILVFLAVGCTPSHPQSTFDTAGPVAESQLTLFLIIFWAAVFVFIVVEGMLVYAVIRFRRKPGEGLPKQVHGHTRMEIAWTIAPAIVLAVIAVPTIATILNTTDPPRGEEVLQVNVTGHQWWWEFEYPELGDEEAGPVVTVNELHIPVGKAVSFTLDSMDVIHSFWVPKLGGKMDVVPNSMNKMWLKAREPGTFFGQCAEFCGLAHAQMGLRVIAEPEESFQQWVTEQQQPADPPITEAEKRGLALFESTKAQCWTCHTVEGTKRARGDKGPNLTHVASRTTIAAGLLDISTPSAFTRNVTRWLRDPGAVKPGNIMARDANIYVKPESRLSDEEIEDLVAYLRTLK